MNCPNCGKQLYDNAPQCPDCGEKFVARFQDDGLEISSHLFIAVLSAVFCMPFGLVAVYFAFKAESYLERDDRRRAMMYSHKAWTWSTWSLIVAGIALFLYIAFFLLMIFAGILAASAGVVPQ